jgi:AsmA-like C-terminal region
MSSSAPTTASQTAWEGRHIHFRLGRKIIYLLIGVVVLIGAAAIFYLKFWPFSREAVLQDLREASDSTVTAQSYHPTFFPPGCVLYGLEFYHGPKHFKLIEIQKLRVQGSYFGMLRGHVPRIVAEGAHVFIPALGTKESFNTQHSSTVVDELVANGSFVEFEPKERHESPLRFDVHEATFRSIRWGTAIAYHLKFHNPNPPGEISADGRFGPYIEDHRENTPFSGTYNFDHADLSVYGGISGMLSSQGKFDGTLKQLSVTGTTATPAFRVKNSGNTFNLTTKFDAYVSGENGDTFLKSVEAHFGHTTVMAQGSIAKTEAGKGKFTKIQFSADHGRIEDVLGLFTSDRAPMSGEIALRATAELPPGDQPFLHKIQLQGSFDIAQGTFSKPKTQRGVDELSAGARGQNKDEPGAVVSGLKGQVKLVDAVAHFSELSFSIPGAQAEMHGTYAVTEPERINLHGQMRVETRISKTTSGVKSFILKVIDPIFKKKKKGEIVPVHILGTYDKPDFGLDLGNKQDAQNAKK